MNYLNMEKRGCNFFNGDFPESDIGNYRITTADYIPLKDGRNMFFEFMVNDKYRYRTENKRTGAKLKKPVKELVMTCSAFLNTDYVAENGYSYHDSCMERNFYWQNVKYTSAEILNYINSVSAVHYDGILFD